MASKNKVKVLAVFGSDNFSTNIIGQSHLDRQRKLASVMGVIKDLNPKKVVYVPYRGLNSVIGGILNDLKIKRTMVLPFPGYSNSLPIIQKLLLKETWDTDYSSAVFMNMNESISSNYKEREKYINEAMLHVVRQSDAALVIHGKENSKLLAKTFSTLEKYEKPTYIFNYDEN